MSLSFAQAGVAVTYGLLYTSEGQARADEGRFAQGPVQDRRSLMSQPIARSGRIRG